jgi:hypothetical protein
LIYAPPAKNRGRFRSLAAAYGWFHSKINFFTRSCPLSSSPVFDGNKRTAFAAIYTFLAINGLYLTADAEETYLFVDNLYEANQFRFEKLVPWLRAHVEKRK